MVSSLLAKHTNMRKVYKCCLFYPILTEKSYTYPAIIFQKFQLPMRGNHTLNFLMKAYVFNGTADLYRHI